MLSQRCRVLGTPHNPPRSRLKQRSPSAGAPHLAAVADCGAAPLGSGTLKGGGIAVDLAGGWSLLHQRGGRQLGAGLGWARLGRAGLSGGQLRRLKHTAQLFWLLIMPQRRAAQAPKALAWDHRRA